MKLMVVGHPFVVAYNQQKYVAMKRLDKNLRLRLVVPTRWCERFEPMDYQIHPELSAEEVVPLRPRAGKSLMTYLYDPRLLAKCLRDFQPDVIHLDPGEPQAFMTVEVITLKRIYAPSAAVTLWTVDNLLRPRRFPLGMVKKRLRAYSLPWADAVLCCNRRAAELLSEEGIFGGMRDVLPQFGLDTAEHQPGKEAELRAQLGLDKNVIIGHVGQMVERKGLRLLFQALGNLLHYPWKLLLVGSGPLEQEIREHWMAKLPGRIVLVSAVPYEQVSRYLRCVDIFVLASQSVPYWQEQFGLALAQAMMLGIPCIGSTSGSIPEVLGPGGLLFEEGRSDHLQKRLNALLDSMEIQKQLGDQGRRFALQHYTREAIAARYLEAFEKARCHHAGAYNRTSETLELESFARKV
jgi:glycosyltransferase involved in cell wall biosynthesis